MFASGETDVSLGGDNWFAGSGNPASSTMPMMSATTSRSATLRLGGRDAARMSRIWSSAFRNEKGGTDTLPADREADGEAILDGLKERSPCHVTRYEARRLCAKRLAQARCR